MPDKTKAIDVLRKIDRHDVKVTAPADGGEEIYAVIIEALQRSAVVEHWRFGGLTLHDDDTCGVVLENESNPYDPVFCETFAEAYDALYEEER